jgi:lysophospholipase L1-like esterase
MPGPKLRVLWPVLALVLVFAAVELGLRVLTDQDSRWNIRLGAGKQFDPVTQFRNKPGIDFGKGATTNEHGYLAPRNLRFETPQDELRLLYLGDSATFSPVYFNYPRQVEWILEAEGVPVQTINVAVPGFASWNARALFENEVSRYDADFCFVYLGWNDLGQHGPEGLPYKLREAGYEISAAQRFLSSFYFPRLVYAVVRHLRRYQTTVNTPLSEQDRALYEGYYPGHFEDNLRAILSLAKTRYPRVYVMTLATITNDDPTEWELRTVHFPTGMDKNMRKLDMLVGKYNQVVEKLAREQGIPLIDFHAAFDGREERRGFVDAAHVTRDGAERMARTVVAAIREAGLPARLAGAAAPAPPPVPAD